MAYHGSMDLGSASLSEKRGERTEVGRSEPTAGFGRRAGGGAGGEAISTTPKLSLIHI